MNTIPCRKFSRAVRADWLPSPLARYFELTEKKKNNKTYTTETTTCLPPYPARALQQPANMLSQPLTFIYAHQLAGSTTDVAAAKTAARYAMKAASDVTPKTGHARTHTQMQTVSA